MIEEDVLDLTQLLEELILLLVSIELVQLLYHIYKMRTYEKKIDKHLIKMDEHILKMNQHVSEIEERMTKLDKFLEKSRKSEWLENFYLKTILFFRPLDFEIIVSSGFFSWNKFKLSLFSFSV